MFYITPNTQGNDKQNTTNDIMASKLSMLYL